MPPDESRRLMTRRRFFTAAVLTGAPLAAGALAWSGLVGSPVSGASSRLLALESPEHRLRRHFGYLALDPEGLTRYFADCARYRPGFSRRQPLQPEIATNYLLSTD